MTRPWWAHARAAFVLFHVAAVTLVSVPSVGSSGMNRSAWRQPTVQGEFRAWSARLGALGIAITPDELEERGWVFARGFEQLRGAVLWPFDPYYRYCGTFQSWKMFVAPHRFPTRVEIAVDRGDGWEVVYLARDPQRDWHADWFDHDRFRSVLFRLGWPHYKQPRRQFLDFVEGHVAADFPDARRVRVSFLETETPTPAQTLAGQVAEPERKLSNTRTIERGAP